MSIAPSSASDVPFLDGINDIADKYDHFILDVFGVLHDGIAPFPGTINALQHLKAAGKQIALLSNSPRRAQGMVQQLAYMNIGHDLYDHIVTSGEATFRSLSTDKTLGKNCWFIGTPMMAEVTDGLGIELLDRPQYADFILNSIPGLSDTDVAHLKQNLKIAASKNLPMICANPDLVVNIGDEQYECAGTFAALYEDIGGRVIYHGKPHKPVYERCHTLLGQPDKSHIIAIGDSLHTDIAGANNFGIDSIFNLVGIHWEEVQLDHVPEHADLKKVQSIVAGQPHTPRFTMAGFNW